MLPSQFTALEPSDFIGPARAAAVHLAAVAASARAHGAPVTFALLGPPGCGKSNLAAFLAHCLGANQFTTHLKNGASFRIEDVEEWQRIVALREMWGPYRALRIEEFDRMSPAAQVAVLTLLDTLPAGNAFIVTSNKPLKDFEARLQRRLLRLPTTDPKHPDELAPPTRDEISSFLVSRFRLLPAVAQSIANDAVLDGGYVGQALKLADTAVCYPHNLQPKPEPAPTQAEVIRQFMAGGRSARLPNAIHA